MMTNKVFEGNQISFRGAPLQPLKFRRAARQLRPDEVEAVLDAAAGGVLVLDSERRIIYHNEKLGQLLLENGRKGLGLTCCDLICSVGGRTTGCFTEALLTQPACCQSRQYRLAERPFEIAGTRLGSAGRSSTRVVLVFRDMTSKVEIDSMRSHFVSAAAHEFLTPLTAILGYAELLGDQQLPKPLRQEGLAIIQDKAEALSRIVENLLDTGRMQVGQPFELTLEQIDVARLLKSAVEGCGGGDVENPVRLTLPEGPLEILADRRRIRQIIDNLLSNAVKYSGAGAPIEIRADQIGAKLHLVVRDRGKGIGPEQLPRVCETFYRADPADTAPSGIGLGLGLVRRLVEAHDGHLEIQSEPGQGTSVCLTMPVAGPQKSGQLALFGTEQASG